MLWWAGARAPTFRAGGVVGPAGRTAVPGPATAACPAAPVATAALEGTAAPVPLEAEIGRGAGEGTVVGGVLCPFFFPLLFPLFPFPDALGVTEDWAGPEVNRADDSDDAWSACLEVVPEAASTWPLALGAWWWPRPGGWAADRAPASAGGTDPLPSPAWAADGFPRCPWGADEWPDRPWLARSDPCPLPPPLAVLAWVLLAVPWGLADAWGIANATNTMKTAASAVLPTRSALLQAVVHTSRGNNSALFCFGATRI
jgi:hypothetical protein